MLQQIIILTLCTMLYSSTLQQFTVPHAPSKLKLDLELMRSDQVAVSLSADNAKWTV